MNIIICSPKLFDVDLDATFFDFNKEIQKLSDIKKCKKEDILNFIINNEINIFEFVFMSYKHNLKDMVCFYNIDRETFENFKHFIDFGDLYRYINSIEELKQLL